MAARLPLWFVLNVPFALILLFSSGLVGYLGFRNGVSTSSDLTGQLLMESAARTRQNLDSFFDTASLLNEQNVAAIRLQELDIHNLEGLQQHFLVQVQTYDSIQAIAYGSERREFTGIFKDVLGVDFVLGESSAQSDFTTQYYEVSREGEPGRLLDYSEPDYDPRPRYWYQSAVVTGHATWTPVYMWINDMGIAIDVVTPIYEENGELLGVTDVSLNPASISAFLQNLSVAQNVSVFIVDEAGLLVASSTMPQPYERIDGSLERFDTRDTTDPFIQSASVEVTQQFGGWSGVSSLRQFEFKLAGEKYLAQVTPYQGMASRWWIVVALPEATYMTSINSHRSQTVGLIIISLVLSLGLLTGVSWQLTRPILQLSQAAKAFAAGNWSARVPVTRQDELGDLILSFNQMADQLHQSTVSLQASESRLRAIFENSAEAIVVISHEQVVSYNPAFQAMFGYHDGDNLVNRPLLDFIAPGEQDRITDYMRRRLRGEAAPVAYETVGYRQDGTPFDMDVRVSTFVQNGELYSLGLARDITERKRAEQALRDSETRLRTIIEAAPIGIGFSRQGIALFGNAKYMQMFGFETVEEITGRPLIEQIAPQSREQIMEIVRRRTAGEAVPNEYEAVGLRKDGSEFPYLVWVTEVNFSDGTANVGFFWDITERKHYETKLQAAERFARSTVDALSAHIAILDEAGTILSVNKAWTRFASENNGDLNTVGVGANYLKVLHNVAPRSQDSPVANALGNAIQQILNGEMDTFSIEYPCHSPDELRWYVVRLTRFADDGQVRLVVAHENITERVLYAELLTQQTHELNERVKELNCLYEHSKLMELRGDSARETLYQGTLALLPAAWQHPEITTARLTVEGHPYILNNFAKTPWRMISPIFLNQESIGTLEVYYLEERPQEYEGPFLREERLLLDELSRRLGRKIETLRAEAALQKAHDTLEEKVRERTAQLQAAKERVEVILDNSVDGILLVNPDLTIQQTNPAFNRLFACATNTYLDQPLTLLLCEDQDQPVSHTIQSYVAEQRNLYIGVQVCRWDGTMFDAELGIGHIGDGGLVCVIRDVTERKQIESALRQALAKEQELGELKSRFVSMASHEFRTPLATILALTETLHAYRDRYTEDQINQRFDKIKVQISHLQDIMDDVLLLARMQARRTGFNPVKVDLDALCRSVVDEFRSRADVRHQLDYVCEQNGQEMVLDRKLMRQIITNLISNAIKYSPNQTPVHISLICIEQMCILTVRDQGIGIPEADMKHLFEPFHRAANTGNISGTGLGLVIAKESVDLHGGTISIESQPGTGTTFRVQIPISSKGESLKDENPGD